MAIERLRPSFTFTEERLRELQAVVPEAFADGKIKWDVLREALGEYLLEEDAKEHFGLTWPGKREARRMAALPPEGTLVPVPGEGVNEEDTRNIFIEGENLEVLKLLQKSYAGRVKMIYIDPPYNTGNDFVYEDDYSEALDVYLSRIGQIDENGRRLTTNTRSSGRFHSRWLSMIYPRLLLARQLLREDGVIFVSIDDNEVHNLRQVMNEVFGEESFFSVIVVQSNIRGQTYKQISKTHEYILVYTTNPDTNIQELAKSDERDDLNFQDKVGRFNVRELRNRNPKFGRFNRPNLFYAIYTNPNAADSDGFCPVSLTKTHEFFVEIYPLNSQGGESCWRWGKSLVEENNSLDTLSSNVVAKRKSTGEFGIYEKYRKDTYKPKSIWTETDFITEKGTIELRQLGLGGYFDFPKPVTLLERVLEVSTLENDLVMDFFSGSCSTAHAVFSLNRRDNGNRQFIMVQLPEPTPPDSMARQNGLLTVADIGKERIRRVIKVMQDEHVRPSEESAASKEPLGFKVLRLQSSHFKRWSALEPSESAQLDYLFSGYSSSLESGWEPKALITDVLLQEGFPLDSQVLQLGKISANTVWRVHHPDLAHELYMCLDSSIAAATIELLEAGTLVRGEDIFVCLDSALSDEAKVILDDRLRLKVI